MSVFRFSLLAFCSIALSFSPAYSEEEKAADSDAPAPAKEISAEEAKKLSNQETTKALKTLQKRSNNLPEWKSKEPQSVDEAIDYFIGASPTKLDPDGYYRRGCELMAQKKYQEALNHLNKALELNPRLYDASYQKALLYQLTGYDKFAARRYIQLLKVRPDYDKARINLAALHRKHKNYKGAEEEYRAAIQHNYYLFEAHYNLANTLLEMQRYEDAMKEYKFCLKLKPNDAMVHNNMGVLYLQKNYPNEALAAFQTAAKLAPQESVFKTNIGEAKKMISKKTQPVLM